MKKQKQCRFSDTTQHFGSSFQIKSSYVCKTDRLYLTYLVILPDNMVLYVTIRKCKIIAIMLHRGRCKNEGINPLPANDVLVAMLQHGHKYVIGSQGIGFFTPRSKPTMLMVWRSYSEWV